MHDGVHVRSCALDSGAFGQIGYDEVERAGGLAQIESAHLVSASLELLTHGLADGAGGSGDQNSCHVAGILAWPLWQAAAIF
jgi:hypothetical protein